MICHILISELFHVLFLCYLMSSCILSNWRQDPSEFDPIAFQENFQVFLQCLLRTFSPGLITIITNLEKLCHTLPNPTEIGWQIYKCIEI